MGRVRAINIKLTKNDNTLGNSNDIEDILAHSRSQLNDSQSHRLNDKSPLVTKNHINNNEGGTLTFNYNTMSS